ncbi:MAG: ABC transporter substrate-binding protein [Ignavibacteria bacterium]|nr:ABC transporter substrate-binding protein [Ignavibacteria bacterium]
MITSKSAFLTIYVLLFAGLFYGCPKQEQTSLRAAKDGKFYGGTYRINMVRGNPNGLDPVIINSKLADDLALQVYDRLISFDSSLNSIPELAMSWEISTDGKLYTFHLRTDVYFHDNPCFPNGIGRKMVARDVEYSLKRCCDPGTRSVHFWAFKDRVVGATEYYTAQLEKRASVMSVSGIRAVNDSTLEIELLRPSAPFLLTLANSLGCVVPREAVEKYGADFFQNPVGTGPFVFEKWEHDRQMTMRRNPKYWQHDKAGNRLPFFDNLFVSFIKDDKIQLQEFSKGNLEECFTIPTEFLDNVMDAGRNPKPPYDKYIFQKQPAMCTWFLDFLCTKPPFNNVDVRRAFSLAIDRDKIVRYVLRNAPYSPAFHGITPPVMPNYSTDSIPGFGLDLAKARDFMTRAGFPNGKSFPVVQLHIYPEPRLVQVAEAVQKMLDEALNVRVEIKTVQFAELLALAEQGKLNFWGTRWYGDYPDAENFINLLDGALVPVNENEPSYPNSTRYSNPAASEALANAVATTDVTERMRYYRSAESIAMNDAPAIMLFYEMHYRMLQPNVRNYPLDAMARVVLKNSWFSSK